MPGTQHRDTMSTALHDLRYGFRTLAKSPGFTVTAVLCLAVGIGGTTAIFSLVHAVLLRPLPFGNPDRLVVLRSESPIRGLRDYRVSVHDFLDYKQQNQSFDGMAVYEWHQMDLIGEDHFERLPGAPGGQGLLRRVTPATGAGP